MPLFGDPRGNVFKLLYCCPNLDRKKGGGSHQETMHFKKCGRRTYSNFDVHPIVWSAALGDIVNNKIDARFSEILYFDCHGPSFLVWKYDSNNVQICVLALALASGSRGCPSGCDARSSDLA